MTKCCRWIDIAALSMLVVLIYLLTADHVPLGSATRYYEATREMAETGNWLVPQLNYVPYVEKPPLVYWLGAAGRLIGDHPFFTSLPSLLATIISVITTYIMGCQWRNRSVGMTAAGLLAGASFTEVMSGVLTTDPLLAAALLVAMYCWWRWDGEQQQTNFWLYSCYAAIACGWLIKGPIALAFPAAGIALYAFLRAGWRHIFITLYAMKPWWGAIIIVAINLPWTLALWYHDSRLVEFFYVDINFDAFIHGHYNHPGPWWYYGPIIAACLAPYSVILLPIIGHSLWRIISSLQWKRDGSHVTVQTDLSHLYYFSMIIGPLILLSISSAKLGTYLMPLTPLFFLLSADVISRWEKIPRWVTGLMVTQATIIALAVALIPVALIAIHESLEQGHPLILFGMTFAKEPQLAEIDWSYSWHLVSAGGLLLLAAIASVALIMAGRLRASLASLAVGVTCVLALIFPNIDELVPHLDAAPLARIIQQNTTPADTINKGDIILVHETAVHEYELLLTLKKQVGVVGNARETGVGFFSQAHPRTVPLPSSGQPISHPYEVNGDNTKHPRLWSTQQLVDSWKSQQRVWLIADYSFNQELKNIGLDVFVIEKARRKALFSNLPLTSQP